MKVALCFERFTLLTLLRLLPMLTVFTLLKQLYEKKGWYAYKPGMDAPPRGEGGVPRPVPRCGEGGLPAPPRPVKMIKTAGSCGAK